MTGVNKEEISEDRKHPCMFIGRIPQKIKDAVKEEAKDCCDDYGWVIRDWYNEAMEYRLYKQMFLSSFIESMTLREVMLSLPCLMEKPGKDDSNVEEDEKTGSKIKMMGEHLINKDNKNSENGKDKGKG